MALSRSAARPHRSLDALVLDGAFPPEFAAKLRAAGRWLVIPIGFEMVLMLPCDSEEPRAYADVDYYGDLVSYTSRGGKTYYLRTMSGPTCCSGHPLNEQYLGSQSLIERGWVIKLNQRRIDGLDARGVSTDGTYWRWVGPLLGEFAEYKGVDSEASKYFDAILDSICFQPRF